jgi:hypothetical protein
MQWHSTGHPLACTVSLKAVVVLPEARGASGWGFKWKSVWLVLAPLTSSPSAPPPPAPAHSVAHYNHLYPGSLNRYWMRFNPTSANLPKPPDASQSDVSLIYLLGDVGAGLDHQVRTAVVLGAGLLLLLLLLLLLVVVVVVVMHSRRRTLAA